MNHATGCPAERLEERDTRGAGTSLARTTRCLDCGAGQVIWLVPPHRPEPKPVELMRAAGPDDMPDRRFDIPRRAS